MSDRVLWFAVFGGPAAWSVDLLAAVAIENDYCVHGPRTVGGSATLALSAVAIGAVLVTMLAATAAWQRLARAGVDTGLGDTDADRRRFMARFAMGVSMLCLFGTLLRLITVLFISPAAC